jgi:hypothetical protein
MLLSMLCRRAVVPFAVVCALAPPAGPAAAVAAPAVVGPGTCAPYADSVTFSVDRSQPTYYCYSGHGTSNIGVYDVYHFYAGASTSGSFHYDYGEGTCGNSFSFTSYQQNDFPTSIHVCSGWHIN